MATASYKPQDYEASSTAHDVKERLADQTEKLGSHMERMAQSASDQASQMGDSMRDVANNIDTAIRRSVKEQPMTTLAMAAAVGFVLGAIWKS